MRSFLNYILAPFFTTMFFLAMSVLSSYAQTTCTDTSTWVGGAYGSGQDYSRTFTPQQFVSNDSTWAYISPTLVDTSYYWTYFILRKTKCITKNFSVDFRTRNGPPHGIPSYTTEVRIRTNLGLFLITLTGMSSGQPWAKVLIKGDTVLINDPSLVFPELRDWTNIKLEFKDHTFNCYLNGQRFFSDSYSGDICNINALGTTFKGSGYLDRVKIRNDQQDLVYFEDFLGCDQMKEFKNECENISSQVVSTYNPCFNDTLFLKAKVFPSSPVPPHFSWSGPNHFSSTQQNPAIPLPGKNASGWYYCQVSTNSCNPVFMDSVWVDLNKKREVTSTVTRSICRGDTLWGYTKAGTYVDTLTNHKGCDSIRTLHLRVDSVFYSSLTDSICEDSHYKLPDGRVVNQAGDYTVVYKTASGCDSMVVYHLVPYCSAGIYLPSAFTPNHDGQNDVFRILNAQGHHLIRFDIYDRWGNRVFHTRDITEGWKGEHYPTGSYVYLIKLKTSSGETAERKGSVILIR